MICRSSEFKNKTATTHWASGSYFPEEVSNFGFNYFKNLYGWNLRRCTNRNCKMSSWKKFPPRDGLSASSNCHPSLRFTQRVKRRKSLTLTTKTTHIFWPWGLSTRVKNNIQISGTFAFLILIGIFFTAGSIPGHSVQFRYLKEGGGSGGESDSGSSPQPLLSVAVKVLLLMMIWGCYGM